MLQANEQTCFPVSGLDQVRSDVGVDVASKNRDLTKLRRRRQGERQKTNRFNEQNNKSARASRFFVHFFAVPDNNDVK